MRHSLVSVCLAVLLASCATAEEGPGNGLQLSIVASKQKSGSVSIDRGGVFAVLFKNTSDKLIHLWSEKCQYGYDTLSFRVEEDGRTSLMCKRVPEDCDWKDYPPRTTTIPPGGTFSWEVSPSSFWWGERAWKGVPEPNTGSLVTLTAVLDIASTDDAKERDVWIGRVTSAPVRVKFVDPQLRTPHEYLSADCPQQALKLIEADPTWIAKTDDLRRTPLHVAVEYGFTDAAKWLLFNGADINARAYNNFTPLHLAKAPHVVHLLLRHGADVNARNVSERTALEEAACDDAHARQSPLYDLDPRYQVYSVITKVLLDAGAEYDIRSACYLDDLDRVRVLTTDKEQARDKIAMRAAATCGHANIVKLLLERGADPEDADYGGLPVSYFAVGYPSVLTLLFDAGSDPKVRLEYRGNGLGPEGSTLLHEAAEKGFLASAKLLLIREADVNAVDEHGRTPLDYAKLDDSHAAMHDLLKRNGGVNGKELSR